MKISRNYYFMGLVVGLICGAVLTFVVLSLNDSAKLNRLVSKLPWNKSKVEKPIYIPDDIIDEIRQIGGIIDYAHEYEFGNILDLKFTKVIAKLTEECEVKIMKPDLKLDAYILKTIKSFNYLSPILYLHKETAISKKLSEYIDENARISFNFSTNSQGYRVTLPKIQQDKKILIAGDSVAFGIGVDNDKTIASHLQKLVKKDYHVINSAIPGYSFATILMSLRRELKKNSYDKLIYIVCQNDFAIWDDNLINIKFVSHMTDELNKIKDNFPEGIAIIYVPFIFYALSDIYLNDMPKEHIYYPRQYLEETELIRDKLEIECRKKDFKFMDFTDVANKYLKDTGTIWSRFALYNDHTHLSSEGARLLAEEIYSMFDK